MKKQKIECPKCKTKFDISKYQKYIKNKIIRQIENIIIEEKEDE